METRAKIHAQPSPELRRRMTRLRLAPRWIKGIRKRYIRLVHGDDYFVSEYFGARFLVHWNDFVAREIALQTFERMQIEHLIGACRKIEPAAFIDIGAHSGLYSCVLLRRNVVPRAILFEPDAKNVALLRTNLFVNRLEDRVEVHEVAAGRAPGRKAFCAGPRSNTGQSRIAEGAGGREIAVVALDDLLDFSGADLAIKIDIEGFELEALAGMRRLLRENRGIVQIESYETRGAVIEAMGEFGYLPVADFYYDLVFEKR